MESNPRERPTHATEDIELTAINIKDQPPPHHPPTDETETPASATESSVKLTQPGYRSEISQQETVWHSGETGVGVVSHQNAPPSRPAGPVKQLSCSYPIDTMCINCKQPVLTYVEFESGNCAYATCIGLALVGCFAGCCLVPFFVDYFKDATHKCPRCHVILGKHKKFCM